MLCRGSPVSALDANADGKYALVPATPMIRVSPLDPCNYRLLQPVELVTLEFQKVGRLVLSVQQFRAPLERETKSAFSVLLVRPSESPGSRDQ